MLGLLTNAVFSSAVFLVLSLLFLKESYVPVISKRRRGLHQNTPNGTDIESHAESKSVYVQQHSLTSIVRAVTRPCRFLITSPIVIIIGFFLAVRSVVLCHAITSQSLLKYTYGLFYVLLTASPLLFGKSERTRGLFNYSFDTLQLGLSYLGLIIGFLIGFVIQLNAQPAIWKYLTHRNGESRPEYRLLPMTVG